ncbi:MAG: prolyl oligopeptidase family serine peptidase [Sumerlaeia bacterium]
MSRSIALYHHLWEFNEGRGVMALLHGTGGDETSLLPIARTVAPGAALLSLRGNVRNDMGDLRFIAGGPPFAYRAADVKPRAHDVADFLNAAAARYGFDLEDLTVMGYSNGGTLTGGMLLTRPEVVRRAVLFRPMVPMELPPDHNLAGKEVLILGGRRDDICPPEDSERLAQMLTLAGARVRLRWRDAGHLLHPDDFEDVKEWLARDEEG